MVTVCAALTVLTHLMQATGFISFRAYAWTCLGVVGAVVVGFGGRCFSREQFKFRPRDAAFKVALALVLLGLLSAALALATNRGSIDDPLYVADAVYRLQHPSEALDFSSHYLYNRSGQPFLLYWYDTANAFEYTQAAVAYLLGAEFLTIYHLVAVACSAFVAPLAAWFLLRQFVSDPWACFVGAAFSFGVLLLLGETHRTLGNFFITRIFHGKTVLMAIGLPLVAAYTMRFLHCRDRWAWGMLLAVTTAMTGLTTSSFVLVPALVSVLLLAHGWAARPFLVCEWIRTVAWTSAALGYLLVCAIAFSGFALKNLGAASVVNAGFPITLIGHLRLVFDLDRPVALTLFGICAGAAGILLEGWPRRFLFGWMGATLLLYLNPLSAPFLIEHLTSPNIYWRLFYVFPFIVTIGLAGASTWQVLSRFGIAFQRGCAGVVIAALVAAHLLFPGISVFRRADVYGFGFPGYKLPNQELADARRLIAVAPPGPMLAPELLAGTITMLDSRFPQLRVRDTTLPMLMAKPGLREEAEARLRASEFVAGNKAELESFKATLETYGPSISSVVLDSSVYELAAPTLDSHGFRITATVGRWILVCPARRANPD